MFTTNDYDNQAERLMRRPDKRKLVWVTWHDAVAETSRAHEDDLAERSLTTNVNLGWIAHQDAKRMVLAHGYSCTGEIDHFTIPMGDVLSIDPAAYVPRPKKTPEVNG
jgi:hypothetical protein